MSQHGNPVPKVERHETCARQRTCAEPPELKPHFFQGEGEAHGGALASAAGRNDLAPWHEDAAGFIKTIGQTKGGGKEQQEEERVAAQGAHQG